MKKFFNEFKTFVTRGNVLDMAVGVIVGGAFTAIVNALSNNILKPLINALLRLILGGDGLSDIYTFLHKAFLEDGTVDLANSIYIDWGAFINAVINFFIIAFVLFLIVKTINNFKDGNKKFKEGVKRYHLDKAEKAELRANGVDVKDRTAVNAYFDKKEADAKAAEEAAKAAEAEEAAKNSTEGLLKQILAELKENKN